ncbi:MAG: 23S rRNA pseudouridine(955/2504/2580) synthase [Gammaproteobacteria bacterium]|nr:23S rRNA pseudouridine(955/2504/2580) synthase [Gammaproteobacteria bacterium]|tara:strand:+ start:193 stop:1155 length:963 start_codon:yes stop_codon:yes gene_type:complete
MSQERAKSRGVQLVEIEEDYSGQRVDNYLLRTLKGVQKSRIYRIIRKGEVRLNGGRVKPHARLQAGDILRIPPVRVGEKSNLRNKRVENNIEKTIIYENKVMLIINKPEGVAVHGGSGISAGIIESLRQIRPQDPHLELVHRLDRGTSGCLMVAKRRSFLKLLQAELQRKTSLKKFYTVITHGSWPRRKQHIKVPIARNILRSGERVSRVQAGGKECHTEFRNLVGDGQFSILEAIPVTGRTHQIRVHCRYAGYPVVGDDKYGFEDRDRSLQGRGLRRMMLHASRLEIPALGEYPHLQVEAPLDSQMQQLMDEIKSAEHI